MLVGYMRVSSDSDRQTTDLQKDALIKAGVDERHIFMDKASGAKDQRPGLRDVMEFLKPNDCLIVWKLDRLGRSLTHLLTIINSFKERNISFMSLTEQMDTNTPMGELLFSIFGGLAQYERALTRERILAGIESARIRGRRGGRRRSISDEKMEAILKELAAGTSKAKICRNFGIKRATLYDSLKRVS